MDGMKVVLILPIFFLKFVCKTSKIIAKEINYSSPLGKNLKVLHLSESSLPDWRIEKSAITAKREGHDVFFAGENTKHNYRNFIFNKIYQFHWNFRAKYKFPFYYQIEKKKLITLSKKLDLI